MFQNKITEQKIKHMFSISLKSSIEFHVVASFAIVIIHIINTICIGIALVQKFLIFTFAFFRDTTFTVCRWIGISFKPKKFIFTILQDPSFSWYFIRWTWPVGKLKNAEYFVCALDLLFLADDGGIVDGSQP